VIDSRFPFTAGYQEYPSPYMTHVLLFFLRGKHNDLSRKEGTLVEHQLSLFFLLVTEHVHFFYVSILEL
jgi:hypothetical protein